MKSLDSRTWVSYRREAEATRGTPTTSPPAQEPLSENTRTLSVQLDSRQQLLMQNLH